MDHGISFKRNNKKFPYTYQDKSRNYIPDFEMPDGSFVEIKGYYTEQAREKTRSFKGTLVLIDKTGIKPFLEYVVEKYGKNFISLYE